MKQNMPIGPIAAAGLAAGVLAGIFARRSPPEVRRLEYRLTLIEELQEVLSDPFQFGMLVGVVAGAFGISLALVGRAYSRSNPLPNDGIQLTIAPQRQAAIAQLAEQAAEQAIKLIEQEVAR